MKNDYEELEAGQFDNENEDGWPIGIHYARVQPAGIRSAGIQSARIRSARIRSARIAQAQTSQPQSPHSGPTALRPTALRPTAQCASDPRTPVSELWELAHIPELRRWIIVNTAAPAALINAIARAGGPGVREAMELLRESLQEPGAATLPPSAD
ncbi:MAG: hypothetical protein PUF51_07300 [Bifidobacteriaceae bacterium]|nr:hypothetical protein [Bifidobacteriaceae bacterium]